MYLKNYPRCTDYACTVHSLEIEKLMLGIQKSTLKVAQKYFHSAGILLDVYIQQFESYG
jgi:hypothetical protein